MLNSAPKSDRDRFGDLGAMSLQPVERKPLDNVAVALDNARDLSHRVRRLRNLLAG